MVFLKFSRDIVQIGHRWAGDGLDDPFPAFDGPGETQASPRQFLYLVRRQ
jgi:hypothetical protein